MVAASDEVPLQPLRPDAAKAAAFDRLGPQ